MKQTIFRFRAGGLNLEGIQSTGKNYAALRQFVKLRCPLEPVRRKVNAWVKNHVTGNRWLIYVNTGSLPVFSVEENEIVNTYEKI